MKLDAVVEIKAEYKSFWAAAVHTPFAFRF